MSFFKKYNGSTNASHVRLERWTWVCIYGGLLALVLAVFMERTAGEDATAMYSVGAAAVIAGVLMIYLRSRMRDPK
jgi:uncharacterized membrane protein HdeD (DUF308 family)